MKNLSQHIYQTAQIATRSAALALGIIFSSVGTTAVAQNITAGVLQNMKIDHVMIGVDNFGVMIAWYREKLGFQEEKRWTVDGLNGIDLAYIVGPDGFRIEFIGGGKGPRTPVPASFPEHFTMRGLQHLSFRVADVDAAVAELRARGVAVFVEAEDYPVGAQRRVAFIKDPEGNVIEFAGPLLQRGQ